MQRKKLVIGLFGFGVVGEGIYNVIRQTPSLNAEIKKVCIKHPHKKRNAPDALFDTDPDVILSDPEINVVVELIDHADDAYDIASRAILNGKSVVSANKKMIAYHLPELLDKTREKNVSFLYEGAVCGSIPVIRNLEEYYDNDLLNSFSGIVNGSTNYILTQMIEKKLPFDRALTQAQELGFAESDPTLDIEGYDAVNKLTIVLKHTYGLNQQPEDLLRVGITRIHPQDVQFAFEKGFKIKLVANALHIDGPDVAAFLLPTFVDRESKLYFISNEYNGVVIGSKLADEQFLYGKGAGRYPTSSAVLSDISALQYDYNYEYRKSNNGTDYRLSEDWTLKLYVSFPANVALDSSIFESIQETFQNQERKYIIGEILLGALRNAPWMEDPSVSVIAFESKVKH